MEASETLGFTDGDVSAHVSPSWWTDAYHFGDSVRQSRRGGVKRPADEVTIACLTSPHVTRCLGVQATRGEA
jgi:hypothetical protein